MLDIDLAKSLEQAFEKISAKPVQSEQAVFEGWLRDKCPSGDVESVQYQWTQSSEYRDFHNESAAKPEAPSNVLFLKKE